MHVASLLAFLLLGIAGCGVIEREGRTAGSRGEGGAAGTSVPPLLAVTSRGERIALDAPGDGPRVLIFLRGAYCGLCRQRLHALADHVAAYDALGAHVFVVVPGTPRPWSELLDSLAVDIDVVAVDRTELRAWGVWPEGARAPRPAAVVLDGEGRVRYRHLGETAADRVSDPLLLAVVRGFAGAGRASGAR